MNMNVAGELKHVKVAKCPTCQTKAHIVMAHQSDTRGAFSGSGYCRGGKGFPDQGRPSSQGCGQLLDWHVMSDEEE